MSDWIDQLEERVGLRPKISPEQKAEVAELSTSATSIVQIMMAMFPDAPESLRQAAQEVLDGHDRLMIMLAEEDDDVPDR